MKMRFCLILCLVFGISSLEAQFGRMSGPPPGPGLSGSTAKLFGENSTFSATLEMQTGTEGSSDSMTFPGKIFFDQGKSRFEMDMSQLKGGQMPPQAAAQMKSMGMDKLVMIARPDKKAGYQVYPGMHAYVENPLPEQEAAAAPSDFKIEMTELGNETVDGHPCIKNKAVVTDKEGAKHESTLWNAKDLKKFPIKIEHMENGTKVTMLFHDVSLSKPAADLFEPPADATKYDSMQSMMQQVMMKRMGGAGGGRPPRDQ
jgi:uncharacterized protein DUF4412